MTTPQNHSTLVVVVNSRKQLEYRRDKDLTEKQSQDLLKLDKKLNAGILVSDQFIESPSMRDKATFVANLLVSAMNEGNEARIALTCTYLATRCVTLKQVRITQEKGVSFQLLYDKEYKEEEPIKFIPKTNLN